MFAPFPQQYKYYDVDAGPNVWEYFFQTVDPNLDALVERCVTEARRAAGEEGDEGAVLSATAQLANASLKST